MDKNRKKCCFEIIIENNNKIITQRNALSLPLCNNLENDCEITDYLNRKVDVSFQELKENVENISGEIRYRGIGCPTLDVSVNSIDFDFKFILKYRRLRICINEIENLLTATISSI